MIENSVLSDFLNGLYVGSGYFAINGHLSLESSLPSAFSIMFDDVLNVGGLVVFDWPIIF